MLALPGRKHVCADTDDFVSADLVQTEYMRLQQMREYYQRNKDRAKARKQKWREARKA